MKHRSHHAANIKSNIAFVDLLVIHFDWKLLPAISGKPEMEDRLALDGTSQWTELPSYQSAKSIISTVRVVNDSSERAIALAKTFSSTITK